MSGGSYDYLYHRIDDAADEIEKNTRPHQPDPAARVYDRPARRYLSAEESAEILASLEGERLWFAELLRLVGRAMHDIEWVDSGDYGPGDEVFAIRQVRQFARSEVNRG
ncbi:MAG TPA: hypothetical protein VEA41_16590 [Salinarimonas sp.]|nr:hypothetical protein [Salinarimonas sp.]